MNHQEKIELIKQFECGEGRSFANGWHGHEAILMGLRDLKAGDTPECRFIVAHRRVEGHVYEVTVRFVKNHPQLDDGFRQSDGGPEHGLGRGDDTALAAAALTAHLFRRAGKETAKTPHPKFDTGMEIWRDTREIL
jgi:hypothetical protein